LFTYVFSGGKDNIIYYEANEIFVWIVAHDIPPFIVFLGELTLGFMLMVMSFRVLKYNRKVNYGACEVYGVVVIAMCIFRPICGLSWYFNTIDYSNIIQFVLYVVTGLYALSMALYVAERIKSRADGGSLENVPKSV
jgi:hypothetical protein